jgi:hypothetical protein
VARPAKAGVLREKAGLDQLQSIFLSPRPSVLILSTCMLIYLLSFYFSSQVSQVRVHEEIKQVGMNIARD